MSSALFSWQEDFRRECGIRRGLILHGNTADLTSDPEVPGQWVALPAALTSLLRQRGYQHVVFWNRIHGVSGIDARAWGELQSSVAPSSGSENSSRGRAYDMGDMPPPAAPAPVPGAIMATADDVLAVAAHCLRQPRPEKPVAFILDWTQYLFGSANSLSENERGWLLRLGQATRDAAVVRTAESIGHAQSLLVMLCGGLNVLPPALYLNNPLFREIAIPLPARKIRESAVLGLKEVFRLQPPLQQGGRELADFVDGLEGQSIRDIHNLARLSRLGVVVPEASQRGPIRERWLADHGLDVVVVDANPYTASLGELVAAAIVAGAQGADVLFLDCVGYSERMAQLMSSATDLPVYTARSLAVSRVLDA